MLARTRKIQTNELGKCWFSQLHSSRPIGHWLWWRFLSVNLEVGGLLDIQVLAGRRITTVLEVPPIQRFGDVEDEEVEVVHRSECIDRSTVGHLPSRRRPVVESLEEDDFLARKILGVLRNLPTKGVDGESKPLVRHADPEPISDVIDIPLAARRGDGFVPGLAVGVLLIKEEPERFSKLSAPERRSVLGYDLREFGPNEEHIALLSSRQLANHRIILALSQFRVLHLGNPCPPLSFQRVPRFESVVREEIIKGKTIEEHEYNWPVELQKVGPPAHILRGFCAPLLLLPSLGSAATALRPARIRLGSGEVVHRVGLWRPFEGLPRAPGAHVRVDGLCVVQSAPFQEIVSFLRVPEPCRVARRRVRVPLEGFLPKRLFHLVHLDFAAPLKAQDAQCSRPICHRCAGDLRSGPG
mmetsp:Transcript_58409/g.190506  ORF Transcript_58409/g.190506 Transcript_58409/m.190506 type:complete len:412 (-) Transcript_58409:303-1538(-)